MGIRYCDTAGTILHYNFGSNKPKPVTSIRSGAFVLFISLRYTAQSAQFCLGGWKSDRRGIAAWPQCGMEYSIFVNKTKSQT